MKVTKTDEQWREKLSPEAFEILRKKGTERAFTGAYWDCHDAGDYLCAGCGEKLFGSDDKFDSGSGWPSFTRPSAGASVETEDDRSGGMTRTEVMCVAKTSPGDSSCIVLGFSS